MPNKNLINNFENKSSAKNLVLFCDGGSRGNPGKAACGIVLYEVNFDLKLPVEQIVESCKNYQPILQLALFMGISTNNQAEWQGLIFGLEKILEHEEKTLHKTELQKNQNLEEPLFLELSTTQNPKQILPEFAESLFVEKPKINLLVLMDSELVVKQARGEYKVKNTDLKPYFQKLMKLKLQFQEVRFQHIYRQFNKLADNLVNRVLDVN